MQPPTQREKVPSRNERGSALVLVTFSLVAGLSVLALAVDLGLRFATRSEAQRAADAAALAGASAFMDPFLVTREAQEAEAERRALEFARMNYILGEPIDSGEVHIDVIGDSAKVRVTIRRAGLPTWFARVFGVDSMAVSARAAATVATSGRTDCVMPWAIVDFWDETSPLQDPDNDDLPDPGESWSYDPLDDQYVPLGATGGTETGLGSGFRTRPGGPGGLPYHRDYGLPITLRPADPTDPASTTGYRGPGGYYIWRHDDGEPPYAERILECDRRSIEVGQSYAVESASGADPSIAGLTRAAVDSLIALDPDAYWEDLPGPEVGTRSGRIANSRFGMRSPRIVRVPIVRPPSGIVGEVQFNNVGLLFLEGVQGNGVIRGRFLYYIPGQSGSAGPPAPLIRYVQLIE
ncbi:MAG TPA: pilus assembly protein TadG-related protein [Longimicrobiales bacterium]